MKESINQYFKTYFNKKSVITKVIILAIAAIVVLIPSLIFFLWLKDKPEGLVGSKNGFWYIYVIWNKGIGFSGLNGKTAAIFAIQSIVFVLLMAIFWFLAHDKISCSFVALACFGGLFNLIQRAAMPTAGVLDYFKFGFWDNFAIFNWPDMFVVIGIFGFVITTIVNLVKSGKKGNNEKEEKQSEQTNEIKQPEITAKVPTPAPTSEIPVAE